MNNSLFFLIGIICSLLIENSSDENTRNSIFDYVGTIAVWVPKGKGNNIDVIILILTSTTVQRGYASHVDETLSPWRLFNKSMLFFW